MMLVRQSLVMRISEMFVLAFSDGTPMKALLTAIVVGTILIIINHYDLLLAGNWPPSSKIFLTYCVPYLVTTWGALTVKISTSEARD
jgi:hypothetical protein